MSLKNLGLYNRVPGEVTLYTSRMRKSTKSSKTKTDRVKCPACSKAVLVRKDGRLYRHKHRNFKTDCAGGGTPVKTLLKYK